MALGDWFDGIGQIGNLGLGIWNAIESRKNDKLNWEYVQKNYAQQLAQFDWEKSKQMEAWNREDNAVQRRVADLRAAGINPLLAAGSAAGSSSPAPVNAPQMGKRDISQSMDAINMLRQIHIDQANLRAMREDIKNKQQEREESNARVGKIKAEKRAIEDRNFREEDLHEYEKIIMRLESEFKDSTFEQRKEIFKNEVERSYLTNRAVALDNSLRSFNIDIAKFESQIKEVQAEIALRFGFENAVAENAVKILAVEMMEIEKGVKRRDSDFFHKLGIPSSVRTDIARALSAGLGIRIAESENSSVTVKPNVEIEGSIGKWTKARERLQRRGHL